MGKASGLNDNQITELAKLEKGVAAISQSDWLEPVLCKVDKYEGDGEPFSNLPVRPKKHKIVDSEETKQSLLECIMSKEIYRKGDRVDIQKLKCAIIRSKLDTTVKCDFLDYIVVEKENAVESLRTLAFDFLGAQNAINESEKCSDIRTWVHSVVDNLSPSVQKYTQRQIDLLMALLIYEQAIRNESYENILCSFTELYRKKGGVY